MAAPADSSPATATATAMALALDDLPHAFHAVASPPEGRKPQLSAVAAGKKREASVSVDLPDDDRSDEQMASGEVSVDAIDECDNASSHYHRPHHPQNYTGSSPSTSGFGVKGTPGGDCKRICLRHQRMVDGGARVDLQKRLEKLPEVDQQTANTIWSLFSSASGSARILTLRGLLTICCPSQLSFLTEQLKAECRLDPFAILPREVALKCMAYLDAMSLGRAAQVSKSWKALADDDLLWRTMCEQHIARKCEKCGWGLPLLEKRRKQISSSASVATSSSSAPSSSAMAASTSVAQAQLRYENSQHNHTPLPKSLEEALNRASSPSRAKRPRLAAGTSSSNNLHLDDLTLISAPPSPRQAPAGSFQATQQQSQPSSSTTQLTRPWKSVYCERLAIARNWARGQCTFKVLQGHSDAITCLQLDDSLHDVPYPVLMTGSWDRTIRIWNAETGACVSVLRGHTRGVRCIQFDSAKLISGGMDSTLRIWSWRTGQCIRTLEGHRDSVISLSFDKHILASGSADSTIKVWDFATAECFTLRGHREWVNQVKIWSPETDCSGGPTPTAANSLAAQMEAGPSTLSPMAGKLLFSASDDGTIKVWDLMTRQCVRTLEGHVAQVQCLKILSVNEPAPTHIRTGTDETQNSYINPAEGSSSSRNTRAPSAVTNGNAYEGFFEQHPTHQQSSAPAGFVTASELPTVTPNASAFLAAAARPPPDPSTLAHLDFGSSPAPMVISGSLDNTLKIWNVEDATCSRTLFGHIEGVWNVDMDKLRIVSASHDRTIKIWDRASGRCLHTLVGHRGAVTSVALGDDKIVSGSDDMNIRIWSFAKQQ